MNGYTRLDSSEVRLTSYRPLHITTFRGSERARTGLAAREARKNCTTICLIAFGHLVAAASFQHLASCVFELLLVNVFELKSLLSHEGRACEVNEAVVGGINDPQDYVIKCRQH